MGAKTGFRGSFTALVTPFKNGSVDEGGVSQPGGLADRRRAPTAWSRSERPAKARRCPMTSTRRWSSGASTKPSGACLSSPARGRIRPGRRSSSPAHAEKAGADAVLVVTPYYNKPTQEGLYQHFKAINDAIGIPIIIYNIPARSVIDMSVDTMKRLYELKNIAGVKDATANMVRVSQQRARARAGVQPAFRRGRHRARLHGPWRPWLHFRHLERGAAAVRRVPGRLPARRLCRRAQRCRTS